MRYFSWLSKEMEILQLSLQFLDSPACPLQGVPQFFTSCWMILDLTSTPLLPPPHSAEQVPHELQEPHMQSTGLPS